MKGVGCGATVGFGVGEGTDDFHEFVYGAGPAVGDEEGDGVFVFGSLVDEVNVELVDLGFVVVPAVEFSFVEAPVVLVAPVFDEFLHEGKFGAVGPADVVELVGESDVAQAYLQVVENFVRYRYGEWCHCAFLLGDTLA